MWDVKFHNIAAEDLSLTEFFFSATPFCVLITLLYGGNTVQP